MRAWLTQSKNSIVSKAEYAMEKPAEMVGIKSSQRPTSSFRPGIAPPKAPDRSLTIWPRASVTQPERQLSTTSSLIIVSSARVSMCDLVASRWFALLSLLVTLQDELSTILFTASSKGGDISSTSLLAWSFAEVKPNWC